MKLLPPDEKLFKPLQVPQKILMGPGPTNASKVVKDACSLPMLGPMDPELFDVMDDIKRGIQYLFQTQNKYTLAVSGTGHAALECSIMNMVEPGDVILVAENGIWGQREGNMVERIGGKPVKIIKPPGVAFILSDFEEALKQNSNAKMLFVTHGESSTGVLQNLDGIGELCHRYHHTAMMSNMYGIREGLRLLAQEGLENCWRRHREAAELMHRKLEEAGFELFVKDKELRLPTVTMVLIPKNVNYQEFSKLVSQRYNLRIDYGLGSTAGKVFQIGLLGENCTIERVELLMEAINESLTKEEK